MRMKLHCIEYKAYGRWYVKKFRDKERIKKIQAYADKYHLPYKVSTVEEEVEIRVHSIAPYVISYREFDSMTEAVEYAKRKAQKAKLAVGVYVGVKINGAFEFLEENADYFINENLEG